MEIAGNKADNVRDMLTLRRVRVSIADVENQYVMYSVSEGV
jgi:hypothetical protein